jgi:methylated-DNA-[protein]-cysteine S-methyltransferase
MANNALSRLHFGIDEKTHPGTPMTGEVADQLAAYFAGTLREFTVPVDLAAASDFTRRVLEATARIPYGATRTYGDIAAAIGMPGATQAVGNALGANPVPIVVPCHRVVRADGSMGWFTGGAHIKRALLDLEGVHFPEQTTLPF